MKLIKISTKEAQWLGMAPSVAGGCVAVSDAGRDAARAIGAFVYRLGAGALGWGEGAVRKELARRNSGWSGAAALNADRARTVQMSGLEEKRVS